VRTEISEQITPGFEIGCFPHHGSRNVRIGGCFREL